MAQEAPPPQGCGEIWLLTRIALGIIMPLLVILVLALVILLSSLNLLVALGSGLPLPDTAVALAVLLLSAGGMWYLVRRQQRQ